MWAGEGLWSEVIVLWTMELELGNTLRIWLDSWPSRRSRLVQRVNLDGGEYNIQGNQAESLHRTMRNADR